MCHQCHLRISRRFLKHKINTVPSTKARFSCGLIQAFTPEQECRRTLTELHRNEDIWGKLFWEN